MASERYKSEKGSTVARWANERYRWWRRRRQTELTGIMIPRISDPSAPSDNQYTPLQTVTGQERIDNQRSKVVITVPGENSSGTAETHSKIELNSQLRERGSVVPAPQGEVIVTCKMRERERERDVERHNLS